MEEQDEEAEEGFVSIGSVFEYLETDEDIVKAKEKKDKEFYVLDKQGRRRFHGAFTGGFSAGYFMSVGTKEGWSPAPFVSSRSQKASQVQQRPEDYMDEEDLDSFGIAPRQVSTRDKFTQEKAPDIGRKRPSVIPGDPVLNMLVVPAKNTIGAQLMKSMGWREGKGVGPTTADSKVKVYGCSLPGSDSGYMEFAPNDISSWDFSGKSDVHGIGYRGMSMEHFATSKYNKGIYGMSGQAFGVGALEEDDEDIFSQDTIASYHTSLNLPSDAEQSSTYGWTGGKNIGESWSLSSFNKSSTRQRYSKVYPPPTVPRGFVPFHKFTTTNTPSTEEKPLTSVNERGYVTGDKSVFDLVSARDKERLKKIKEGKQFRMEDYQPFSNDPEKQSRYDAYLQGSKTSNVSSGGLRSLTEWERQKEAKEFDRVAKVHKPLTTSLSDKFTRGTEQEEDVAAAEKKQVNPADVEMFGQMTREVCDWHPHRILCIRFNIPDPYPNSSTVGIPDETRPSSNDWRKSMKFESSSKLDPASETVPNLYLQQKDEGHQMETDGVSTAEKENEQATNVEEEEEEEKPSVTLLKSIFAESSSEEEEEEEEEETVEQDGQLHQPAPAKTQHHQHTSGQHHRHTSQPSHQPAPENKDHHSAHSLDNSRKTPQVLHSRDHQPHLPPACADYQFKEKQAFHTKHRDQEPSGSTVRLSDETRQHEARWKNLAEVIKPTLSAPQKLEEPLVYVRETFGPSLPPSLVQDEGRNDSPSPVRKNSTPLETEHSNNTDKSKDKAQHHHKKHHKDHSHHKEHHCHKEHHHHKAKRKHSHKHHH